MTTPKLFSPTPDENAMEASFDGIEVQATNGYVIDQSNNCSLRIEICGGCIESRNCLALEVVSAIEQTVGPERIVIGLSPWRASQEYGRRHAIGKPRHDVVVLPNHLKTP
ncbi:hypothetical protein INT44_006943 [Umbelopsis vinacea]|uniref:NADH:flavin oxidoreductase/NADH oxidase N-terminal domain-containing protein n=1 Tax=Umbelopsis vinacea TaxID=44442 RepID=A0A8H7PJI1_9FUNG|nr:hypothetical protein INT44_006943 [Umbelopsis vinacea]